MAVAIEYGLLTGLIAVVFVAGASYMNDKKHDPHKTSAPTISSAQQVINNSVLVDKIPDNTVGTHSHVAIDKETGCRYIIIGPGITVRYTTDGKVDCPYASIPKGR
jgi:Flp pilus assembly pilin Flp